MPQAIAAAAVAGATATTGTVLAAAGLAFAQTGVAMVVGEIVAGFTRQAAPNEKQKLPGTQLMFRAPDAPLEIIYGQTRKSGPIVFQATSGEEKEYLHLIIALAGHEVEEIGTAYLDGVSEADLIHTHQPQTIRVGWQGTKDNSDKGSPRFPVPDILVVLIDDQRFQANSAQIITDLINASDLQVNARAASASRDASITIEASNIRRPKFSARASAVVDEAEAWKFSVFSNQITDSNVLAFDVFRHSGAVDQEADEDLVKAFGSGRRARVVLKWDTDRAGINLTLQGQHLVGRIDDIQRLIESSSFADDISVRKQDESELVLEHSQPGQPIDFSSSNGDFSHEYLDAPLPVWTTEHTLSGIAYAHVRFARRSEIWGNNVPQVSFDIKGKNDIEDSRAGTRGYTDNWALCVRDYLINYMQVPATRIDNAETALAATICDERVDLDGEGATQARYTLNGTLTEAERPGDVLAAMAQHGGWIIRRFGIWSPLAFAPQAPTAELSFNDFVGLPAVTIGHDSTGLFNAVQGTWKGADSEYNETPAPLVTSPFYVSQDNGKSIPTDIRYRFADDSHRAQRLGKIALERHRQQITVQLSVKAHRLDCDVGAVVPVTDPEFGWDKKLFFVADSTAHAPAESDLSADTTTTAGARALILREYADEMFSWNHGEATNVDLAANTNLDPSRYVETPRDFAVSTSPAYYLDHSNNLELAVWHATWRAPAGSNTSHYRLQWRTALLPEWRSIADTRDTTATHGPISDTSPIDIRIQAVAPGGRASRWVYVLGLNVTSVATLTGGDGAVDVTKSTTAPAEPDTNDIWLQTDGSGNTVAKYYWNNTQWTDISGSAIATAIANAYEAKDLADGAAKLFVFPSTTNPAPTASGSGDLWLQPDTRRIMRWTGATWVVATSMDWDDIFGGRKPADLANSEGTMLNDTTFSRLKAGYDTWELGGGAELVTDGEDGAALRLQSGSFIINKTPIAIPASRYLRVEAVCKGGGSTGRLKARLRAIDASGNQPGLLTDAITITVANTSDAFVTFSGETAVELGDYRRAVLEIFMVDSNPDNRITLDTIELKAKTTIPSTNGSVALSHVGLNYPFYDGDGEVQGDRFEANTAYFGGSIKWPSGTRAPGSLIDLRYLAGWIQQPEAATVEYSIEALCDDGEWRSAAVSGGDVGEMFITTNSTRLDHAIRFVLRGDAVMPVQLRSIVSWSSAKTLYAWGLRRGVATL